MMTRHPSHRVYFYPHGYLRDRQLDTLRQWPKEKVVNPELAERAGSQIPRESALSGRIRFSWKQRLPLINVKRRPLRLPPDVAVYLWGGITATGPFIVDLDNPYALVGYNLRAMSLWRPVLRAILGSSRCLEIRCMSQACREGLYRLFGRSVASKARVVYPRIAPRVASVDNLIRGNPRFLFVATQFEIKGGQALLRAFPKVRAAIPTASLDLVTHLPKTFEPISRQEGVRVHEARFSREEIWRRFMANADVLVHPTYVETFGMVVLEALAHGVAVIATDVYAMREMVHHKDNGALLAPPISIWDDVTPSRYYPELENIPRIVQQTDISEFEISLAEAMTELGGDSGRLLAMRKVSLDLFYHKFVADRHDR